MQNNGKLTKIKGHAWGHVKSQLQKQILNGKLCFRPFWKDRISKNIIIEIVFDFFKDYICKTVNSIYTLKNRKNDNF